MVNRILSIFDYPAILSLIPFGMGMAKDLIQGCLLVFLAIRVGWLIYCKRDNILGAFKLKAWKK